MGQPDKVVAITGASSGIGEATALMLAERGAKVVLGARGPDRLNALTARILSAGGEASCIPTDVTRRADLEALVALACERYGKLDALVNNAGIMPISPLADLRVEDWEQMVQRMQRIAPRADPRLTHKLRRQRSVLRLVGMWMLGGLPVSHVVLFGSWGERGRG